MRHCLFCNSTNLTREHLWPDWLVKMFPTGDYSVGRTNPDSLHKEWFQPTIAVMVRCVCDKCNSGWMSRIEGHTKPILKHLVFPSSERPFKLSKRNQTFLAVWAILRSFIVDRAGGDPPFHSNDDGITFATSTPAVPMRDTCIWLARTPDNFPDGAFLDVQTKLNVEKRVGFQTATYALGQVTFQVFHWMGFGTNDGVDFQKLRLSAWHGRTVQIWPLTGLSVIWPPPERLTPSTIDELRRRFSRHSSSSSIPARLLSP
jgi:hypothetical protein